MLFDPEKPKIKPVKAKVAPFIILPDVVLYNFNIPFGAQKLYSVIKSFCEGKGGCFVSNQYLSKLLFLDERTIAKYIIILEKWKYIIIKNKKTRNRKFFLNTESKNIYSKAALEVYLLKNIEDFDAKELEDAAKQIFINALIKNESTNKFEDM